MEQVTIENINKQKDANFLEIKKVLGIDDMHIYNTIYGYHSLLFTGDSPKNDTKYKAWSENILPAMRKYNFFSEVDLDKIEELIQGALSNADDYVDRCCHITEEVMKLARKRLQWKEKINLNKNQEK